jgi:multiple sugar transport system permease protein
MTRAYTLGFTRNDIGGASVVLLCVTLLLTVTVNYLRKRGDVR